MHMQTHIERAARMRELYIYTYTYIFLHISIYIYLLIHIYTYIYIYSYIYIYKYISIYTFILCMNIHTYHYLFWDHRVSLRINQIMSSKAPSWTHFKLDHFSIKNRSNNELWSFRLDPYQIWWIFSSQSNHSFY